MAAAIVPAEAQRPRMFGIERQHRVDRRRRVGEALFGQRDRRTREAERDLQLPFRGRFLGFPLALPLGFPLEPLEVRAFGAQLVERARHDRVRRGVPFEPGDAVLVAAVLEFTPRPIDGLAGAAFGFTLALRAPRSANAPRP